MQTALISILSASLAPLAAALPIAAMQESAPATATTDVVAIPPDRHARPTVPVLLNTKGPFRFLIDTGSERTILARSLVQNLGLTPSGQRTLMGVAGSLRVDVVPVDTIALGRHEFYGIDAPVLDGFDIGAEGIVGLDSLQGQRVLIDFKSNRMAVGDAKSLGGNNGFEIVVHARRRSGQLIMTNALVDGVRTDVVLDTGAETTIGNRALQEALRRRRHKAEETEIVSVTGQTINAQLDVARQITLDGLSLGNTVIAYADAPPFAKLGLDKKPALFLGMTQLRLFRRIAIDFASRSVLFDLPPGVSVSASSPMPDRIF